MGKQKAHKRKIEQERRAKESLRNGNGQGLGALPGMIASGQIETNNPVQAPVAVQDRPATPSATGQPPIAPPSTHPQFPRGERRPGDTIAGQTKYDLFFAIVAKAVREDKVTGFRPLGFIPGPAIIVELEGNKIRIIAGTPEETRRFGSVPTDWLDWNALPEGIRKPLEAYQVAVTELDHHPSSYHRDFSKKLLAGNLPPQHLTMLMSNFRYKAGDPERPFGIVMLPAANGVKIAKIYNPANVPDVPAEGTILPLDILKNGFGPVQKMLRTWALMEDNYSLRFDEKGNRLPNGGYHPPARPVSVPSK